MAQLLEGAMRRAEDPAEMARWRATLRSYRADARAVLALADAHRANGTVSLNELRTFVTDATPFGAFGAWMGARRRFHAFGRTVRRRRVWSSLRSGATTVATG